LWHSFEPVLDDRLKVVDAVDSEVAQGGDIACLSRPHSTQLYVNPRRISGANH
jgi:hypothetical protein